MNVFIFNKFSLRFHTVFEKIQLRYKICLYYLVVTMVQDSQCYLLHSCTLRACSAASGKWCIVLVIMVIVICKPLGSQTRHSEVLMRKLKWPPFRIKFDIILNLILFSKGDKMIKSLKIASVDFGLLNQFCTVCGIRCYVKMKYKCQLPY